MLLITKPQGFLYVSADSYVPFDEIKLNLNTVETPKENTKALISFNGSKFTPYYPNMPIPKKYKSSTSINIRIRLVDRDNITSYTDYTADTLAVSNIVVVGQALKHGYPMIMTAHETRMTELEKEIELLRNALIEHINSGSLL